MQSTSGLQLHALSGHCSVVTPPTCTECTQVILLISLLTFYVQFSHSFRPGLWHSCIVHLPGKSPLTIGLRNRAINVTVTLTEITGKAVVQVPIKFCPMRFFQACAKAKVRKFHMALWGRRSTVTDGQALLARESITFRSFQQSPPL